jgi:EAL domain-containing protein (putative c-di-GMP-specific phosphodiesterase class I)
VEPQAKESAGADPDAPRVLIVDDDAQLLALLVEVLRKAGYRVVAAESGESAMALVRELGFDLAVCDRQLPGMDGIALLEHLHREQPMCARVLLTGALDLPTTLSAVNRSAVGRVVEKPVRGHALLAIVNEALDGRRRMVEAYQTMQQAAEEREKGRLQEALGGAHVQIALQPIVHAAGSAVFGYEALLRSSHPDFAGPAEILGAAERHGMLRCVADVVADRVAAWLRSSRNDAHLFLNVHPAELAEPDALAARLEQLQPWAPRIILEITERSSIYGVTAWEVSMEHIRRCGFEVAVDDLGAGYSALSVLAELQPRYIKVDMSIVRDSDRNPHKRRLVDLLCRFADATASKLVAEGVETEGEAATMRACGAHLLQGYLFGRPRLSRTLRAVIE